MPAVVVAAAVVMVIVIPAVLIVVVIATPVKGYQMEIKTTTRTGIIIILLAIV